jgi:Holliday junction resolvasome RuvABC endonuclease subunit
MEYILALDLSLSCIGCALFSQDGILQKLISIETDPKSETKIRLKKIADEFIKIKKEYKPKIVLIEQGFYRFNISTEQIFRVHGIANYIFYNAEQVYYHSTTIRKIVAGKGNIKKDELRNFIINKYGNIDFKNFDESDAVGVGLCFFIKEGILK